jgi:hypothetical protein
LQANILKSDPSKDPDMWDLIQSPKRDKIMAITKERISKDSRTNSVTAAAMQAKMVGVMRKVIPVRIGTKLKDIVGFQMCLILWNATSSSKALQQLLHYNRIFIICMRIRTGYELIRVYPLAICHERSSIMTHLMTNLTYLTDI